MMKLLVILGPTATGKTDLALSVAKELNGELVACDSRQVYKGLDIGTGKMPSVDLRVRKARGFWEIDGVRIWLYDVADPKAQYTVADYVKEATRVVNDITSRGKLQIVVGGTGFYLKALMEGLPNLSIRIDKEQRKQLAKMSVGELQDKLQSLSPGQLEALNESDRRNPRRLIRKLELLPYHPTNPRLPSSSSEAIGGQAYMETTSTGMGLSNDYDVLKVGLTAPREVLYKNIDLRVLARLDQGMVNEAEDLHQNGLSLKRMRQLGLEYGILANYLDGKFENLKEMTSVMQFKIHGYLRRQQTWFKKEKDVNWVDISEVDFGEKVEKLISKWYHGSND